MSELSVLFKHLVQKPKHDGCSLGKKMTYFQPKKACLLLMTLKIPIKCIQDDRWSSF